MEDLDVVGHKTEKNKLEDFWMSRVSNLEKQYDEHIVKLEKKLFDNRFHSRVFTFLVAEKDQLAAEFGQSTKECKELMFKVNDLGSKLKQEEKDKTRLQEKIGKVQDENTDLWTTVRSQQYAVRKAAKESSRLGHKLTRVGQEKNKLAHDVAVRETELRHWRQIEEREEPPSSAWGHLAQISKADIIKTKDIEARKSKLVQLEMNNLIKQSRTEEDKLHDMRRNLEEITKRMTVDSMEIERAQKEKVRIQSNLQNTRDDLSQALGNLKLEKQRTEQWREEVQFRDSRLKSEVTRNEICRLRGKVATLSGQLKSLEKDRERYWEDRSKLALKLKGLESLEKSVAQLVRDNVRTRNHILNRLEAQAEEGALQYAIKSQSQRSNANQGCGYGKQIKHLEKRIQDLEGQMISTRRRENTLRWTIQNQSSTLISQVHWTNKAKFKVEVQNRDYEKHCNVWARRLSQKPISGRQNEEALDREVKEKILRHRLISQTSKLEKLKSQHKLLPKLEPNKQPVNIENWKWSNFIQPSPGSGSQLSNISVGKQDEFIETLNENIELIGQELKILLRKQAIAAPVEKEKNDIRNSIDDEEIDFKRLKSLEDESPLQSEGEVKEEYDVTTSSSTKTSSAHSAKDD